MIESNRGSEAYIICTQPRRVATINVAARVAEEYGEKVSYYVHDTTFVIIYYFCVYYHYYYFCGYSYHCLKYIYL